MFAEAFWYAAAGEVGGGGGGGGREAISAACRVCYQEYSITGKTLQEKE
jgi:hypothetical protein